MINIILIMYKQAYAKFHRLIYLKRILLLLNNYRNDFIDFNDLEIHCHGHYSELFMYVAF